MRAIKNERLIDDLSLLVKANDWKTVGAFFTYWNSEDELIDKVLLFGNLFLGEYFRDPSPAFHRKLLRDYFSRGNRYNAAPRGFSKTTMLQCAILFECINRSQRFIVLIEKTFTEGAEVLSAIRAECVENELLVAAYGDLLNNERSVIAGKLSKSKDAEGDLLINGVRLRAKGFDQPVRGLKTRAYRPTRIILDDVEQDEHIRNPEQRTKYEDNFNKGVQPAIDRDGSIKVFGTILHEDSLLANLIRLHGGNIYRAYYREGEDDYGDAAAFTVEEEIPEVGKVRLLWPTRWSWAALMKKREEMKSKNMSFNAFEQELRNKPIAEEERQFKWEWLNNPLRRIPLDTLLKTGKTLVGYATVDAAESMADGADSTASIVALIDPDMNWYIVDVRNEKRNIKDLVLLPFQLWEKWSKHGLIKVGVERKAFDDQLAPLLEDKRREMSGIYPVIEELKPMGRAKEARILGALQGRFELGRIWFCTDASGRLVGDTEKLIHQLYDFPASAHDDLSDALAYVSDIAKTPMQGERFPTPARNPSDDPWAADEWTGVRPIQSGVIEGMPHDVEEDAFL